jgi:hypothetical protein
MAKFKCVCGHAISTSGTIPNPDEWELMSDVEFDEFKGLVNVEELYLRMKVLYRCPHSDHLWVFWDGIDSPPKLYSPAI